MSEGIQPARIDEDEYERFKQFVQDVHGKTRGHLSTEIENALREYRTGYFDQPDRLDRIEQDLSVVRAALVDGEGDGGATPDDSTPEVRAPADGADDPPAANQPRHAKADWVAGRVRQAAKDQVYHRAGIRSIVKETWGFSDDVTETLVDMTLQRLDAEPDPRDHAADGQMVWGDAIDRTHQEAQQEAQDDAQQQAQEEADRLAAAERTGASDG